MEEARYKLEKNIINSYPSVQKDIIIVVKDGYEFVKPCIESVLKNTNNFTIYIWDNGSADETKNYLSSLAGDGIIVCRSETNVGFIKPNNKLVELAQAPYFILLNSDCVVNPQWDQALTSMLQLVPTLGVVGYSGALLNEDCIGLEIAYGYEIDFVQGFCLAMRRSTYLEYGLFDDKNLIFAYGEDSDLCLRLREKGLASYALGTELIVHKGGATSIPMFDKIRPYFNANHNYLKKKWSNYLEKERIYVKKEQLRVTNL